MKLNKNIILSTIVLFLTVTYLISFNSHFTHKDSSEKIKTELINEKYLKSITKFQFTQGNSNLFLIKTDDFWVIRNNENSKTGIPADSKKIEQFISDLTQLREIKKLSNTISSKNNYGFDDENTICLRYFVDDENFSDLIFGGQDFALSTRYLMVSNKASVFELDDTFDKYLDLSVQQWSDPTIISLNILGTVDASDIQSITITNENGSKSTKNKANDKDFYYKSSKLLEFRHGGIGENVKSDTPVQVIQVEFGNKEWVTLNFYESSEEGEYVIITQYFIETINKKYYFTSKISNWTYNRINETIL